MELLLKRVIVMIITISVSVPSLYLTMSYYQGTQYEKNPLNYIPQNTVFVSQINGGYGVYYAFFENNSIGIISSMSVFMIPQLLNSQGIPSNVTANTTLQYFEEYRGISIFQLEGVNASSIINAFVEQQPALSYFINATSLYARISNMTFFIASPENTLSIIGSEQLVKDSIDAHTDYTNLPSVRNVKLNSTTNVSLYFFPSGGNLEHLSLNMSTNYTQIYLAFNQLNSTYTLAFSSLAVKYGFKITIDENSVELVTYRGFWAISQLLGSSVDMSSLLGGLPI